MRSPDRKRRRGQGTPSSSEFPHLSAVVEPDGWDLAGLRIAVEPRGVMAAGASSSLAPPARRVARVYALRGSQIRT